jgi:anti-sigma B factor antagonist
LYAQPVDIEITSEIAANGEAVVTVVGAIDLASRDQLLTAAHAALNDSAAKALVLDLAGITFIDSTGIGAIVELAGDADDVGRGFSLRKPSARVTRILEMTGLSQQWKIDSGP